MVRSTRMSSPSGSTDPALIDTRQSSVRLRAADPAGAKTLRTLIVVPTLNEADHIDPVLVSLLSQLSELPNAIIAVVDGGSTDGTCALVARLAERHPELHLLHNPRRIQSSAVNLAARTLGRNADVLIRCDAHARYPSNFFEQLLRTLVEVEADSVVVPMLSTGSSATQSAIAWVSNSSIGTGGSAHRGVGRPSGFVDHGHHAAFRMDMFSRAGGYDETYSHNEDAELDCRQRALNAKIYLDTSIHLEYQPRSTPQALWRQYLNYGAGRSRTVRRHPASLRLRQVLVVVNLLALCGAVLLSPWWPLALVLPISYLSALATASVVFALRRRSWAGLLTGPMAAIMHTAWAIGFLLALLTRKEPRWCPESAEPLWSGSGFFEF